MKHFLTASAMLCSFLAAAQFPNLPYNPDENGDGLIGVVDLQGLLANYGNEFASAVVSEDGESAIVYMGDMEYPHCKYSCDHLPGFWSLPELEDLVPVWGEVAVGIERTWLFKSGNDNLNSNFPMFNGPDIYGVGNKMSSTNYPTSSYRCYCAAKQLPRVEYTLVYGGGGNIQSSAEYLVAAGWMPLDLTLGDNVSSEIVQTFWRWAE